MAKIETLTEEERALLQDVQEVDWERICEKEAAALQKALRIIDAQAAHIAELDARNAKARQRISELEAQVLAQDTVSRAEYDAIVKQRDTMRRERADALSEAEDLRRSTEGALFELEELRKKPIETWHLDEAIFALGGVEQDDAPSGPPA